MSAIPVVIDAARARVLVVGGAAGDGVAPNARVTEHAHAAGRLLITAAAEAVERGPFDRRLAAWR
ncbi:MAG: hypothetical protein WBQ26_01115 [Gemmatimonadaceae bacterium]|nr:hypothetical protein [Gemmatimonadaceae bacterium]